MENPNRRARQTRIAGVGFILLGALFAGTVYVEQRLGYPTRFRAGDIFPVQGYIGGLMFAALGVYCIWRGGRLNK